MTLEVPEFVVLMDGSSAMVKRVFANVTDARLVEVTFTVEKQDGAWADVPRDEARRQEAR